MVHIHIAALSTTSPTTAMLPASAIPAGFRPAVSSKLQATKLASGTYIGNLITIGTDGSITTDVVTGGVRNDIYATGYYLI